jgi:hypothetical protein
MKRTLSLLQALILIPIPPGCSLRSPESSAAVGAATGAGAETAPVEPTAAAAPAPAQESAPPFTPAAQWSQEELEALSKQIEGEVAALRGTEFQRPVTVRIATRADFLAYARQRMELTTPPEQLAADETIAKLLGVIPPDMDLLAKTFAMLEEQVGGYYDPLGDAFCMMDGVPKGLAGIVLSHELGHALDDQLYALDGPLLALAGRTDASLAYQSVVEGSGTSLMNQWMFAHLDSVDLNGSEEFMNASLRSMATVPMWIWKPLVAVYTGGASFLVRSDSLLAGQTQPAAAADVAQAFRTPPRSTEQVLHPAKYWDPARVDEPVEVALATDGLPKDWSVVREDTLGELMLAILCTSPAERGSFDVSDPTAMLGLKLTNLAAAGWDGDRVVLCAKGTARYLVLVTRWDSQRDAAEFLGALSLLEPSFQDAATALGQAAAAGAQGSAAGGDCGAEVDYGLTPDEVVLRIHANVERRDLRKLDKLFARTQS